MEQNSFKNHAKYKSINLTEIAAPEQSISPTPPYQHNLQQQQSLTNAISTSLSHNLSPVSCITNSTKLFANPFIHSDTYNSQQSKDFCPSSGLHLNSSPNTNSTITNTLYNNIGNGNFNVHFHNNTPTDPNIALNIHNHMSMTHRTQQHQQQQPGIILAPVHVARNFTRSNGSNYYTHPFTDKSYPTPTNIHPSQISNLSRAYYNFQMTQNYLNNHYNQQPHHHNHNHHPHHQQQHYLNSRPFVPNSYVTLPNHSNPTTAAPVTNNSITSSTYQTASLKPNASLNYSNSNVIQVRTGKIIHRPFIQSHHIYTQQQQQQQQQQNDQLCSKIDKQQSLQTNESSPISLNPKYPTELTPEYPSMPSSYLYETRPNSYDTGSDEISFGLTMTDHGFTTSTLGFTYPNLLSIPNGTNGTTANGFGTNLTNYRHTTTVDKSNSLNTSTMEVDISKSNLFMKFDQISLEEQIEYRDCAHKHPPFTFHHLIYMALQCLKRHKITFGDICNWITEHFAFYRNLKTNWQDTLRQNLSLSRCFQRVPRRKEEPGGKGDLWRLNPEFQNQLANNKVSAKFLSLWQNSTSFPKSDESSEVIPSNNQDPEPNKHSTNGSIRNSNRPNLRRFTSLDQLANDFPDDSNLIPTTKRRRTGSSDELGMDPIGIRPQLFGNDTSSSCSASTSSPPLSDLCTPPPELIPETPNLSPFMMHSQGYCSGSMNEDEENLFQKNVPYSHRTYDSNYTNRSRSYANSPPILIQQDPDSSQTSLCNDFTLEGQFHHDAEDSLFRTDPNSELDGVAELSKACGLHEIPTLDLSPDQDPLDLTIRGISLKPPSEWWTSGFSESITQFLDGALQAVDNGVDNDCGQNNQIQNDEYFLGVYSSEVQNGQNVPLSTQHQNSAITDDGVGVDNNDDQNEQDRLDSNRSETSFEQCGILNGSPLGTENDHQWIDEQLNLEELDSILGLS